MDAPSFAPVLEPFVEDPPLDFDEPMNDEFWAGVSDDLWGGGEVAHEWALHLSAPEFISQDCSHMESASEYSGFLHGSSATYSTPVTTTSWQHGFVGVDTLPANGSPLVPGIGFEQNPIDLVHLPLNGAFPRHSKTASPLDVNDVPQSITPGWSSSDRMRLSVLLPDAQQLASLSVPQLESFAKTIAQAQGLARERELKESADSVKPGIHNIAVEDGNKLQHGVKRKQSLFHCQESGCDATFRRNKDRTRHIRVKHQENPGFICPVVDCTMGTGHIVQRSDKLRDHLRGKAVSTMTWRCILLGCSETGVHKAWWFEHIKEHDHKTREANSELLINYGYKDFYQVYLLLDYLCPQPSCPWGTISSTDWDKHILFPHNGPCHSCPIPECKIGYKDWDAVAQHLAADHTTHACRESAKLLGSRGFDFWRRVFTCPILSCREVVFDRWFNQESEVRQHCTKHDFATLLSVAESLLNACRFTFEDRTLRPPGSGFHLMVDSSSNSQIFSYLAFTDAELLEAKKPEDLDRMCLDKGIDLA